MAQRPGRGGGLRHYSGADVPTGHAGRTPFTWKDERMWFRRSDIETRAAVVAFHTRRGYGAG